MQALRVCEAEVEDLEGYLGALCFRSGGAPNKALLVLDIAWIGLLVFGRMGELETAQCCLLGGCELVERTMWMHAAHVLVQRCDTLPLDETARLRYCTFTEVFRLSRGVLHYVVVI